MDNVNEDEEEVTTFGETVETTRSSYIETAALNIANVAVEIEEKKAPIEEEIKAPPEVTHDSHGHDDDKK